MNWFTIENPDADTYVISEYRHWEQTHAYLLTGRDSALLIDSGLGVGDLRKVVRDLTALPVTAVLTHAHWDHIGGFGGFSDRRVHRLERAWLTDFPVPIAAVRASLTAKPCDFPVGFDPAHYRVFDGGVTGVYEDGTVFDLGGRKVVAVHTPGHSPGHTCFYEEARGYLFTGDLIYMGQIDAFYPTTDPQALLSSVCRVEELRCRQLFPGHFSLSLPEDFVGRVADALRSCQEKGLLRHGCGRVDFGNFSFRF